MKVQFVSPFVTGATTVIQQLLDVQPKRGDLSAQPQVFTSQQVNVVCGVTGQVQGQVIFGMSLTTAGHIASKMVGLPVTDFDALAASAIAELGNMISGNSITGLANAGFMCDITPPTIIRGSNVKISTVNVPALIIPLELGDLGHIEVIVSLQEKAVKAAA